MANVSSSSQREDNKEESPFAFPFLLAAVSVSFCTALWDKSLRNQAFVLHTNIWLCLTNPVLFPCQKTFGTNWFVEYLSYFYCYSTSNPALFTPVCTCWQSFCFLAVCRHILLHMDQGSGHAVNHKLPTVPSNLCLPSMSANIKAAYRMCVFWYLHSVSIIQTASCLWPLIQGCSQPRKIYPLSCSRAFIQMNTSTTARYPAALREAVCWQYI